VATLYDLLSPAENRPKIVELGNTEFDVEKVGLAQSADVNSLNVALAERNTPRAPRDYSKSGYFLLDTRLLGNHNTGHSFEGENRRHAENGVVGRLLTEREKQALIEFLKSI
jgi:hypothetical protein